MVRESRDEPGQRMGRLDIRWRRLALLGLLLGATLAGPEAHAALARLEAAPLASVAWALLACTTALSLHTHQSHIS